MQASIPVQGSIEIIENTQINPLISKCKVKVFYVGHNRNGTYIDRDHALELGRKLPGSPIVGFYNSETQDFEAHNRELGYDTVEKKYKDIDQTKPYGFVPTNAEIWFQKFEENGVIREYLCTECYIWTDIYPESQRIVEKGNNQSMELNEKTFSGNWAEDPNNHNRFFIVNEAIIEKLCVLGEDYEPCFEGAQFGVNFSIHRDELESLKQSMYAYVQDMLKQGGFNNPMDTENKNVDLNLENQNPDATFEKKDKEKEKPDGENTENKEGKNSEGSSSENKENTEGDNSENKEKDKEKKKYSLDEIEEYQTLKNEHATLQRQFAALEQEKNNLLAEIEPLRAFKLQAEKAKKEAMINSFYMLSDEDKADVVANIDKYSLEEIESKLAVIGLHNKVNFGLSQETEEETPPQAEENSLQYSLEGAAASMNDSIPAWIRAVQETEKNL